MFLGVLGGQGVVPPRGEDGAASRQGLLRDVPVSELVQAAKTRRCPHGDAGGGVSARALSQDAGGETSLQLGKVETDDRQILPGA